MQLQSVIMLFLLLVLANGTPLVIGAIFGSRLNWPLDAGIRLRDGRRLFGPAKTLRGITGALLATTLLAPLFDLTPAQGALFGLLAMSGDLLSSFLKRRLGIDTSRPAPLLDQLPETLIPLWVMGEILSASSSEILAAVAAFSVIDVLFSRLRDAVMH